MSGTASASAQWSIHRLGLVERVLKRRGYPPDKQERAVQQVIEKAEALSAEWAA